MTKDRFKLIATLVFVCASIFCGHAQDIVFQKELPQREGFVPRMITAGNNGFVGIYTSKKEEKKSFQYFDTDLNAVSPILTPLDWKTDKYDPSGEIVANDNAIMFAQQGSETNILYLNLITKKGVSDSYVIKNKYPGTQLVGLFNINNKFIMITRYKEPKVGVRHMMYTIDENNLSNVTGKLVEGLTQNEFESSFYFSEKEEKRTYTLWKVGGALDSRLIFFKAYADDQDVLNIESCEVDTEGNVSEKRTYPMTKNFEDSYKRYNVECVFDAEKKEFYVFGYMGSTKTLFTSGFFVAKYGYKSSNLYTKSYANKEIESSLGIKFITTVAQQSTRKSYIFDPFNHNVYLKTIYSKNSLNGTYNIIQLDNAAAIVEIDRSTTEPFLENDFQNTLTANISAYFDTKIELVYSDNKNEYAKTRKKNNVDYIIANCPSEGTYFSDFWTSDFYYVFYDTKAAKMKR